jgi:hypothetical protein
VLILPIMKIKIVLTQLAADVLLAQSLTNAPPIDAFKFD